MTTTVQIRPRQMPHRPEEPTGSGRAARAAASERGDVREMLAEVVSLVECVPVDGPPLAFLLGPWLFVVVMLAGPFACLLAIALLMIVGAAVLATVTAAVLTPPYLLVGHVRRHRARQAATSPAAPQRAAIGSPRVAA
jgi:hypothetical protein